MLDDGSFPCAVERAMRKLIYLGVWSTQELGWGGIQRERWWDSASFPCFAGPLLQALM